MPKSPDELRICGSIARGTPKAPSSSSSQSRVARSMSSVRDALVTSVACSPVRFHSSQRVRRAEEQLAALGALPGAIDVRQDPGDLARREVGRERQASAVLEPVGIAVGDAVDDVLRAGVLPDDRVVHRLAGRPVPDDRRLALVRDAHGGDVVAGEVRVARARGRSPRACSSRSPSDRARPSPPAGSAAGARAGPGRPARRRGRRRSPASRWCPGRSRGRAGLASCVRVSPHPGVTSATLR